MFEWCNKLLEDLFFKIDPNNHQKRIVKEGPIRIKGGGNTAATAVWPEIAEIELYRKKLYENILATYHRCFVKKGDVYYVGNHRLVENFKPIYFVHALAKNKAEGKYDNYLIDTWFQSSDEHTSFYMLVVKATGERLNTMIPYAKEPATYRNFLEQLHQEYKKNLAIVLAEKKNHE